MAPTRSPRQGGSWRPIVVKLGGSLIASRRLAGWVSLLSRACHPLVIVPGGGGFAAAVRDCQTRNKIPDRVAHRMAILAMHQTAMMLEAMEPRLLAVETLAAMRSAWQAGRIPVWLPLRLCDQDALIPADWSITSDGLAARLAERLNGEGVVLVKSCAAPQAKDADTLVKDGIVDPQFARIVARARLDWRIVGPGDERKLMGLVGATRKPGVPRPARGRPAPRRSSSTPPAPRARGRKP